MPNGNLATEQAATGDATDPIRAALNDIVIWSEEAPLWQRDALRRLYVKGSLDDSDSAELWSLCRQPHNLTDPEETIVAAITLNDGHIPTNLNSSGTIALKSLGRATHVNALAEDQTLNFAVEGLTIVYGDNGAGKSGYGRILKHACRARDQEDILSNAYSGLEGTPSAQIQYCITGVVQPTVQWHHGVAAHPNLSHISVFDSKCASVHVENRNELAYTPLPLQLLQALAEQCRKFTYALKEKKLALESQIPHFKKTPKTQEGTAVHQLVTTLSGTTNRSAVSELAKVLPEERSRMEQLQRDLSSDPNREIRDLKSKKQRVEALLRDVEHSEVLLAPEKTEELRSLLKAAQESAGAVRLAAEEAFSDEPLPQAGSETWRILWEAARSFSTQEAYAGISFPNVEQEAVCVLCQQVYTSEASARLKAFDKFVLSTVQQKAEVANRAVEDWKDALRTCLLAKDAPKAAERLLREEMEEAEEIWSEVVGVLEKAVSIGGTLVEATDPAMLEPRIDEPTVTTMIQSMVAKLDLRISDLQKASNPEERKNQQDELRALQDKFWLSEALDSVLDEVGRLEKLLVYEKALADTDTNRITRKTTELSRVLVTDTIRDAFAAEASILSISDRRIEMSQESSGYGSTKFKVSLIRSPKAKVASILSEGEHRCVALAAFLAELSTAHNRSGIIFDDPVSSLDHNYRHLVAARLAQEAATGRQIIVFTHDIPFLMLLDEAARNESLSPQFLCISRGGDRAGICTQGAPLKAMSVADIVQRVRSRLASSRALHAAGRMDEWSEQVKAMAGLLRDGWERSAESAVSPVVRRFNNAVHTGGLRKLTVLTEADCDELKVGYTFCCTYCHTDPYGMNRPEVTPEAIESEVDRLETWSTSIQTKQNQRT